MSTRVPTVMLPAWRKGSTAKWAAFSMSATSAGVANTSIDPEPYALARFDASTVA